MITQTWLPRIALCLGVAATAVACGEGGEDISDETTEEAALFDLGDGAKPVDLTVATLDPATRVTKVRAEVLKDTFANGVKVASKEVIRSGRRYYLVRTGARGTTCQTESLPLVELKGQLNLAPDRGGGLNATQGCNGNPCSSCGFTYGPEGDVRGCYCKTEGRCNHTITTTTLGDVLMH